MKTFRILINIIFILILATCSVQTPQPTKTSSITISPTSSATTVAMTTATAISTPTEIKDVSAYHLSPQTADKAQEILTQAEQAVLDVYDQIESYYPSYYRAAEYAAWDALLHFPDDKRAKTWRWKAAYYAAMGGDGDIATNIYSELITQVVNNEKMSATDLPSWFRSGELKTQYFTPRFKLEMQPVKLTNNINTYLVNVGELEDIDTPGSICLLLIEKEQRFETFLIYNGFPLSGFFVMLRNPTYCTARDMTNDGIDEIVVDNYFGGHVGTTTIQVFDISSLPPKALPFNSSKDDKLQIWGGGIRDYPNSNEKTQIQISQPLGQCDIYITRDFEWNGQWFDSKNATFTKEESGTISLEYCGGRIAYIPNEFSTQNAIQMLDQALQAYTPESDQDREILEELRIEKGLLYILEGDQDKARSVLKQTVQSPFAKNSIWIKPVTNFLETYKEPSDLYRACSALTACDPYLAEMIAGGPNPPACVNVHPCDSTMTLDYMTSEFASKPLDKLTTNLRNAGVEIASEGWIDLDNDDKDELWFTVMPPDRNDFQFWIASGYPSRIRTFYLNDTPSAQPNFDFIKTLSNPNVGIIDFKDAGMLEWKRDPITEEPILNQIYRSIEDERLQSDIESFRQLQYELYKGNNSKDVYEKILDIKYKFDSCPFETKNEYDTITGYYDCTAYYYTIGLAAELSGDSETATETYHTLLKLYADRPLALLAQSKLDE